MSRHGVVANNRFCIDLFFYEALLYTLSHLFFAPVTSYERDREGTIPNSQGKTLRPREDLPVATNCSLIMRESNRSTEINSGLQP